MPKARPMHSKEFKAEAVRLVKESVSLQPRYLEISVYLWNP